MKHKHHWSSNEENIQWLDKHINIAKNNHTDNYFIEMCKEVTEYQKE